MQISSQKGVGTVATLTIPIPRMEAAETSSPTANITEGAGGSTTATSSSEAIPAPSQLIVDQQRGSKVACRLLVVDDDGMVRDLIHMVLLDEKVVRAGWAFDIETAEDGYEAVQILAAEHTFDVVLMDVNMLEMNGIEATRAIRAYEQQAAASGGGGSHVMIIGHTANIDPGSMAECFAAGMDDVATKPCKRQTLISKIDQALVAASTRVASEIRTTPDTGNARLRGRSERTV